MTRQVPARGVALIKDFEKLILHVYDDGIGVPTAGWGHVVPNGKFGEKVTQRQAELWLAEDLQIAAKRIERKIGADVVQELTDNQFGALVSFVFNLGAGGASPEWKIWGLLRARKFDQIPAQMARFVNAGGKKLNGLVRRRNAEIALWSESEPGSYDHTPPSSVTRQTETPPTPEATKPLAQSKTVWAGAVTTAAGVAEGARQVQALVAPQAAYSDYLANLGGVIAAVIVAAGVAIMVFRYLDNRKAKH